MVVRHVWEAAKERIDAHRLTPAGKKIYARRKETVERSFADAKQLHGHRYARFRGLSKVQAQCLLAAACQNMKKIVRLLALLLPVLTAIYGRQRLEQALRKYLDQPGSLDRRYRFAVLAGA